MLRLKDASHGEAPDLAAGEAIASLAINEERAMFLPLPEETIKLESL